MSLIFGLAFLAVVVIFATHRSEERELVGLLGQAHPLWLAAAVALQALTYLCEAAVWFRVLVGLGERTRFRSLIPLSLAKLFLDQTFPSGGISGSAFVIQALSRRGVSQAVSFAAMVIETMAEYAAFAVALILALVVLRAQQPLPSSIVIPSAVFFLYVMALLVFLALLVVGRAPRHGALARFRPVRWLVDTAAGASRRLTGNPGLLVPAFALELAIFVLDAATFWCTFRALGASVHPGSVFAAFMLASVARTIGFVPGGLGLFEAVSVASLHLTGTPVGLALAATLLLRGCTFWIPLLPGLVCARRETAPDVAPLGSDPSHDGRAHGRGGA